MNWVKILLAKMDNRTKIILRVFLTLAVFALLGQLILGLFPAPLPQSPPPTSDSCTTLSHLPQAGQGFSTQSLQDESIGVSDGSIIFDTKWTNKDQKCQGAIQFRQTAWKNAGQYWTEAVVLPNSPKFQQEESNDAESLIYRENSRVLESHLPFITFVVATILTGNDRGIGRDVLQGVYVAQEEFNRTHADPRKTSSLQICLLVANFGSTFVEEPDKQAEEKVTQMILTLSARQDLKVKGVVLGLPFTSNNTIADFNQAKIPVTLSGSFSQTQLLNTEYIFPITTSLQHEGQVGAAYIRDHLKATKIALFVNKNSLYSSTLADAFQKAIGDENITEESYIRGNIQTITDKVDEALNNQADLIYFAGDAADADIALGRLQEKDANIPFMGGSALYELGGYTGNHYKSLYFTSFAFPDEWGSASQHPFPTLYRLLYTGWPLDRVYGYLRPDGDAILSYDALAVLLDTSENIFSSTHKDDFSSTDLQKSLKSINAFQGFSGKISFGSDHDEKAIVVLYVPQDGLTQMVATYGCLLVTCTPV